MGRAKVDDYGLGKRFEVTSTFRQGCAGPPISKTSTNAIGPWFHIIDNKHIYGADRLKIVTNFGRAVFGGNGGRKPQLVVQRVEVRTRMETDFQNLHQKRSN